MSFELRAASLILQNEKKNTHFLWCILRLPQMENLFFKRKNKLIARGLQLAASRRF